MTNYAIHSETYRSCTIRIEPDDDSRENPFKEFDCEPTQVLHEKAQDRPRAADSRKTNVIREIAGRSVDPLYDPGPGFGCVPDESRNQSPANG